MIICNLAVLLAERHLKISKVAQDTGISRTTLTALANNYGKGIQFDTIDTLCLYLRTTPEQLISFVPVVIDNITATTSEDDTDNLSTEVSMNVELYGKKYRCSMPGDISIKRSAHIDDIRIDLELYDEEANTDLETKENNQILNKAFGILTRPFIERLAQITEQKILDSIEKIPPICGNDGEIYKDYRITDGYSASLNWPFDDWGKS